MYGRIYKLTNKLNGMIYVGQTTRDVKERFQEHCWRKTSHISRALKKYGAENFTIEVIEECETSEQLNEREIFWIAHFNCMYPNGYNHTEGGEGNWERTPEGIAKMSRKGQKLSDEIKIQLSLNSAGREGRPLTDEEKSHLSDLAPNKRKVICVETETVYDSISEAARCHNVKVQILYRACKSPQRMAAGFHWKFADAPEESTENETTFVKPRVKRHVVCVETGEEFKGAQEAARCYGVNRVVIARACNNPEKIAAGHHWKFIELTEDSTTKETLGKTTKPRRVMCIETGEIFDSLSEAERKHNITRSSIVKVCKGSMYTAGGKHWKFVDEVAEDDADRETHHLSEEHKALLSSKATTKKPVICVETGKIYESVKEASRVTEIRENNIRRACKETNRTAGGYHWLFVNEPQS